MKYPYIGKNNYDVVALLFKEGLGVIISELNKGDNVCSIWANNKRYKNITREYLANTYGKVESREHAEFIKLLAESNGIDCDYKIANGFKWFYFIGDGDLIFTSIELGMFTSKYKLIHLPLPPKEDKEVQHNELIIDITNNTNHEINVTKNDAEKAITVTIGDDVESTGPFKNPVNNAGTIKMQDELPNNGDNLMFAGEDKRNEWPCVGSTVTWGNKTDNAIVKSIDGDMAWVKNEYGNYWSVEISELQKQKTPEQDLRDELLEYFNDIGSSARYAISGNEIIVNELLEKYNITKKTE